jgi:plastocyanin
MHRSTIVALVICCAAALGLAACSSSSSKGSSSGTSNAAITIKDLQFTVSSVKAGSEVTVKNSDGFQHTVTADNGEFNVSVDGNGHATFKAPTKPGSYKFHCNIHPTMHGTLDVT